MRPFAALLVAACLALQARAQARAPALTNGGLPSASPDGMHVAFWSNREGSWQVYVLRDDGTDLRRLSQGAGLAPSVLTWTRDGARVVFSSSQGDTARVFAVSLNGEPPRAIGRVIGHSPALTPDEHHLICSAGTFPFVRLSISDLNGANARPITDDRSGAFNATFAPDGRSIAYSRLDSANKIAVWLMNGDGSSARQVSHIDETEGGAQWPAWSPDGRSLAIQVSKSNRQDHSQDVSHIWVIDLATNNSRRLTSHTQPYLDETPSWFPDGQRIVFQSNRTGRMEIWLMNADGSGARQLTQ